ncbi:MAG: ThiF family adenylyltransferase [Deltaproteobacteria bacterium]|nr:ThiF family adenylyltransferase [Deltaproteobacteria bacterium]
MDVNYRKPKTENRKPSFPHPRLDRQLLIPGWNQDALERAAVAVAGDDDLTASLYALAAAALGVNRLVVLGPRLDPRLIHMASRINPLLDLTFIQGFYTHPALEDIFQSCRVMVDFSLYGLANKQLLNAASKTGRPLVRAFGYEQDGQAGVKIFTYMKGREWEELADLVARPQLPGRPFRDATLALIAAALALEDTKNLILRRRVSRTLTHYRRPALPEKIGDPEILLVGAGALGNFVGLALAEAGFHRLTFMDPEKVEVTNLNRQVFFYDALGQGKAETLSARLNESFGARARFQAASFGTDSDISSFDAVFDCVDNFETRVLLSEACRRHGKILISGGTHVEAGQMVVYDPVRGGAAPGELLGLQEIVGRRRQEASKGGESCLYQPEPSVIMTNQVIAGFMADAYRRLLAGQEVDNIFYDAGRDRRI